MVQKHHHIHESREEWASRTTLKEALYSGFLALFIGLFFDIVGQLGFSHFQDISNVFGVSTFIFLALLFRSLIRVDWYHKSLNSLVLFVLSILFIPTIIAGFGILISEFDWIMLILLLSILGVFGYEINHSYNRSYLGSFVKKQIKKIRKKR